MTPIQPIRVESIVVDRRMRRGLREGVVQQLVASIREVGLIHPLTIRRPAGDLVPHLVAGAHRLAAVKRLGWEAVGCCTMDDVTALVLLTEIDENLIHARLSPAQRAHHIHRRKKIYEELHPETKHGGAPGAGRGKAHKDAEIASFSDDTAAKTGRSKRSVAQDARRAEHIERLDDVVGTSLDQGVELDALAALPAEQQDALIDRAVGCAG